MADPMVLRDQAELSEYRSRPWIVKHFPNGDSVKKPVSFEEWLRYQRSPEGMPSTFTENPRMRKTTERLLQIAPDWSRRVKIVPLRMKTMLRIYLSKWFWQGLDYFEAEFVLLLMQRLPGDWSLIENQPSVLTTLTGRSLYLKHCLEDDRSSLYNPGVNAMDWVDLVEMIHSEPDFLALWNLRSVQSFRDFIFTEVTGHEHEGKKGIRKPRIRGYRDGKASPRDPRLTALARKVDQIFWETKFEERWQETEEELARLAST